MEVNGMETILGDVVWVTGLGITSALVLKNTEVVSIFVVDG